MTPPLFAEYTQMDQSPSTSSTFEITIFLNAQAVSLFVEESTWQSLKTWFSHVAVSRQAASSLTLVGETCGLGEPKPIKLILSPSSVSAIAQHL